MDFESFYDKQPDYIAFRDDPSKRKDYDIIADWKVRNLLQLVTDDFEVGNVLEVGCAFGVLLNKIADNMRIKTRIGIDISAKNIELARTLFPDCFFFQGTFENFIKVKPVEIKDQRVDLIVLSDIIEHLPDDLGFLEMVSDFSSYVLLNLPLEKSFSTRNRQYGEHDPSGHLRCYDEDLAKQIVTKAGFEIITSFTSTSFFDKQFYKVYKKNRSVRVLLKPIPHRIFWTLYYLCEDNLKKISRRLTDKIYGTNYFALLRSKNL